MAKRGTVSVCTKSAIQPIAVLICIKVRKRVRTYPSVEVIPTIVIITYWCFETVEWWHSINSERVVEYPYTVREYTVHTVTTADKRLRWPSSQHTRFLLHDNTFSMWLLVVQALLVSYIVSTNYCEDPKPKPCSDRPDSTSTPPPWTSHRWPL